MVITKRVEPTRLEPVRFHVVRSWVPDGLEQRLKEYSPRTHLGRIIKDCFDHLPVNMAAELLDAVTRSVVLESQLSIVLFRADGSVEDKGVVSRKVITDAGVNFLVDTWQNSVELESMRQHGLGTSSTAEAAGQTDLVAELTTQYSTNNTRVQGTIAEGASANIFQTVATITVDEGATIEEHGLFDNATVGSGVMWDRSLTGTQTLSASDSLQATYSMTASSGG